jgi:hypothetical protein
VRSFNIFILFDAIYLVVLVCLFVVCLCQCLLRIERTQLESSEDEELQEQELNTLSSYYLE